MLQSELSLHSSPKKTFKLVIWGITSGTHRTSPPRVRAHCRCRPHTRSRSRSQRPGSNSLQTSSRTRGGNSQWLLGYNVINCITSIMVTIITSIRSIHTDHSVTAVLIARTFPLMTGVRLRCCLLLQQLLNLLLYHPWLLHVMLGVGHQVVVVPRGVVVGAVHRRVVSGNKLPTLDVEDFSPRRIISFYGNHPALLSFVQI